MQLQNFVNGLVSFTGYPQYVRLDVRTTHGQLRGEGDDVAELLRMENISKRFGPKYANRDVNLMVNEGEVHTLLGENGAGKSTLMNVLVGLYQPTDGKIFYRGKEVRIKSPADAVALGIGMVHQHFMLIEAMTGLENIVLGTKGASAKLDRAGDKKKIEELADRYGLEVDLDEKVSEMSIGMQQRVEILKVLYRGAELLILDEPTAVLTDIEVEGLFDIIDSLTAEGKSVIFISHKMREVMRVSDKVTILRDGESVQTLDAKGTTGQHLADLMIGREFHESHYEKVTDPGEVVMRLENVSLHPELKHGGLKNVSLELHRGEIVGIAGVDGNGQTELVEVLTGLRKADSGHGTVLGKDVFYKSSKETFEAGISSIPADRQKHGLILEFSNEDNLILQHFEEEPYSSHGILNRKAIKEHAEELIEKFDVRPRGCAESPAGTLSGGNQQKVIIAREVTNDGELLIAMNPTRGLDVGAIEFVHKYIVEQRNKNKAVLLVSFELDEIMSLSDRIEVIFDGQIVGSVAGRDADENQLGFMMAGGTKHEQER